MRSTSGSDAKEPRTVTGHRRHEQVNVEEVGNVDVDRRSDDPLDDDVRAR